MKVKFANTEVDVWKLRKGSVVSFHEEFLHIVSFKIYNPALTILKTSKHDGNFVEANTDFFTWLEPH